MSYCKKNKKRTIADKVFYRIHMIRSWRNYEFYFPSSHNYQSSFYYAYLNDYSTFCFLGRSLRSFLASCKKDENLVRKVFDEENDFSFRRERSERIKKLKKHGKAKLLIGRLYDDEKEDVSRKTPFIQLPDGTIIYKEDCKIDYIAPRDRDDYTNKEIPINEKRNSDTKSLEEIIKKLVELMNLQRDDSKP